MISLFGALVNLTHTCAAHYFLNQRLALHDRDVWTEDVSMVNMV
jgi:hypothetical protein